MYNRSIYPIGLTRKSVSLALFGMGRFRIVGVRNGMPVINAKLDQWQLRILDGMGVIAI